MVVGPVFRRESVRGFRSIARWVASASLAGLIAGSTVDPQVAAVITCIAAGLLAVWSAFRVVETELDDGTLEMLAMTPMALPRILEEITLACAFQSCIFALPPLAVAAWRSGEVLASPVWGIGIRGAAIALALAAYGSMGALRVDSPRDGLGHSIAMLVCLFLMTGGMVWIVPMPLAISIPGTLALGCGGSAVIYSLWRLHGGQWPELVGRAPDERPTARTAPASAPECARSRGQRPTPDWVSPILWRELGMGQRPDHAALYGCILAAICGVRMITEIHSHVSEVTRERESAQMILVLSILSIWGVAAIVASRTARDRHQGNLDAFSAAPLAPLHYPVGMILGTVITAAALCVPCLGVVYVFGVAVPGVWLGLWIAALAAAWPLAGLSGYLAARETRSRAWAVVTGALIFGAIQVAYALAVLSPRPL